jgi:hypothetical protein
VPVAAPAWTETYADLGVARTTASQRLAIASGSAHGRGNQYPVPFVWARHTAATSLTWRRSRTGLTGDLWLQSVDFGKILS